MKQVLVSGSSGSLWLLYGAVTLLLSIACINIATLLLARTAERQHEIALRYALGASRTAVVLQLLSEVFVLAFLGSIAALVIVGIASRLFRVYAHALPRASEIVLDWHLVTYTLVCAGDHNFGLWFTSRDSRIAERTFHLTYSKRAYARLHASSSAMASCGCTGLHDCGAAPVCRVVSPQFRSAQCCAAWIRRSEGAHPAHQWGVGRNC